MEETDKQNMPIFCISLINSSMIGQNVKEISVFKVGTL